MLEAHADIDPLTGLANRRAFERELTRALAYVKRHGINAALLYLDLDDFKGINDRHGHSAGDAMLRAVASVLGRHVRESDLVARIGGDEFALLLWQCDEANAAAKAQALEASIGRTTAMHEGMPLTRGGLGGRRHAAAARRAGRGHRPRRPRHVCAQGRAAPRRVVAETLKIEGFCPSRHNVPHSQDARVRLSEGQIGFPSDGGFRC